MGSSCPLPRPCPITSCCSAEFKALELSFEGSKSKALLQIPIGLEGRHRGVVDLITLESIYFKGDRGEVVCRTAELPEDLAAEAKQKRTELIETLADLDEELAELYIQLEDKVPADAIHKAIRRCTLNHSFCPLLMGSAKANKGVQPLLDAVCRYLPAPGKRSVLDFYL